MNIIKLILGYALGLLILVGLVMLLDKFNILLVLLVIWMADRSYKLEKQLNAEKERNEAEYKKIYSAMDRLQERTEKDTDRLHEIIDQLDERYIRR